MVLCLGEFKECLHLKPRRKFVETEYIYSDMHFDFYLCNSNRMWKGINEPYLSGYYMPFRFYVRNQNYPQSLKSRIIRITFPAVDFFPTRRFFCQCSFQFDDNIRQKRPLITGSWHRCFLSDSRIANFSIHWTEWLQLGTNMSGFSSSRADRGM